MKTNSPKRWGSMHIKTINVWHPVNRPTEQFTPDLCVCVCVWLNIYAKYTHKAHNHRCRITNTCIMDGGHYQRVLSRQLCIHEMSLQTASHYLYLHRHRGDSLTLNAWNNTGSTSFLSCVLESVHKSDQINSRQRLPEVPVTNRFLIWFEGDKNSWIKFAWRKKKKRRPAYLR